MKNVLMGVLLAACLSTSAFAQNVCGFVQRAASEPGYTLISGAVCISREAAIAVSRHWRDQEIRLTEAIDYVNAARGQHDCHFVEGVAAKHLARNMNTDQFDRTLVVEFWEISVENITGTFVSANYLEGCS